MTVVATTGIASALGLVTIGASLGAYKDDVRIWYIAGGWVFVVALFIPLVWAVIWPGLNYINGPLRDSIRNHATRRGLVVLDAAYGGENVTAALNRRILDRRLNVVVTPQSLGIADPAPNVRKCLDVRYAVDGKDHHAHVWDGDVLSLP